MATKKRFFGRAASANLSKPGSAIARVICRVFPAQKDSGARRTSCHIASWPRRKDSSAVPHRRIYRSPVRQSPASSAEFFRPKKIAEPGERLVILRHGHEEKILRPCRIGEFIEARFGNRPRHLPRAVRAEIEKDHG